MMVGGARIVPHPDGPDGRPDATRRFSTEAANPPPAPAPAAPPSPPLCFCVCAGRARIPPRTYAPRACDADDGVSFDVRLF